MTIEINPIYETLGRHLNSTPEELRSGPKKVDYSLTERTWKDTAISVLLVSLKIFSVLPALYLGLRWCVQRLVMSALYPAQSSLVKCFIKDIRTGSLDQNRVRFGESAITKGVIVRHVSLMKDGNRISGLMIARPETINNGKWALQATGNMWTAEGAAPYANAYERRSFNLLIVNNPGVGRSEGTATPETIGDCQRTAISYLVNALKAKTIVLAGHSLGGGSISQAILQPEFEKTIDTANIHVLRQATFNKLSDVAVHLIQKQAKEYAQSTGTSLIGRIGRAIAHRACQFLAFITRPLIRWTGSDFDNVSASKKLSRLDIPETVIQAGADELFSEEVTLGHALREEPQKNLRSIPLAAHNHVLFMTLAASSEIKSWEEVVNPNEFRIAE